MQLGCSTRWQFLVRRGDTFFKWANYDLNSIIAQFLLIIQLKQINDWSLGNENNYYQRIQVKTMKEQQPNDMNEYSFRISTEKLQSQFQCTVCLNSINDCFITRCGHVYCKGCIEETINRHHRCPFCNQELNDFKADVFKNYHFNTLKKIIDDEKRKENDKYLGKVFSMNEKIVEDKEGQNKLMKPIQKAIVSSCQDALLKYRKYLLDIYLIMKETEEKKLLLGLADVKDNDTIIKQLHQTIIEALPSPIISPQLISLPTQIQIVLSNKKTYKTSMKISPLSPLSNILPFLQNICSENNVRIQGKIPSILIINGQERHIEDKFGALCGKKIKIQGIPIETNVFCFTYNWEKQKITDFYSCKDCNVKWICQNCSILCHTGHTIALQIKGHKADWACCYCATKCQCKALNKNSKIK